MQVGSAEIGSTIEVVEWDEPPRHGVDERHGHRPARPLAAARDDEDGGTQVELRLSYQSPGSGCSGRSADRVSAPV